MHKRTQLSQLSTKYTEKDNDTGASSYVVNKKRDMFQPVNERNMQGVNQKEVIEQNGSKFIPKNVLIMNPCHSRSITWPQIFMSDEELYVSLKGNFYTIRDSRNKQKFIQRKSMPYSETVYFNVQKSNDRLVMVSVQRFMLRSESEQSELWYHVDLVIWNVEDDRMERRWAIQKLKNNMYSGNSMSNLQLMKKQNANAQIQEFKCIQLVDNYRKALIVFDNIATKQCNNHRYEIVYIDFSHNRNRSSNSLSSQYIPSSRTLNPPQQQSFNTNKNQSKIVGRAPLQRMQSETRVKLINSDYGDIVLLVTSEDIYQLQINSRGTQNQHSIVFKPLNISRMLLQNKNTYISTNNIANLKQSLAQQQLIIDAQYIPSSLKFLILTTHGRVMVIQSQQCIFTESLYQLLSPKDMQQLYNIQYFLFKNIHFLNGLLIVSVQAEKEDQCNLLKQIKYEESILDKLDQRKDSLQYISRGLVVAKLHSNTVSFNKFISLPFDLKTYKNVKFHSFQDSDQLLIQTINTKNPSMLQLHKCQIISNKNSFIPFETQHFLAFKPEFSTEKIINTLFDLISNKASSVKVTFGKSQRILYSLRGNEISCYRINTTEFSNNQESGIKKMFSTSFFQKPIKLVINPLTGQIVVLFREFIKIFSNVFTELRILKHINIREVKDISFSRYGENMLWVMNDNTIHLVDSYTLKEHKVMDFQGQVKQISYPSQYLLSIKSSKSILSIYKKRYLAKYEQKTNTYVFYDKLYQIKIQADDHYYVDQSLTILLKKSGIVEIYSHVPEERGKGDSSDDNEQLRYEILKNEHPHLVNRKNLVFEKNDSANYLFYSSQFSTLFIGTKFGYIHQYLYPFLPIEDLSPPQSYKYQLGSTAIIHIQISADFQSLYVVSEMGEIIQLKFEQFLNGLKKNGIYVVSKTQNVNENTVKYEFANRTYLMDTLATINTQVSQGIKQSHEQICFIDDKIKNDIEDVTTKIKSQSHKQIHKISSQKKSTQSKFKSQFDQITLQMKQEQKIVSLKLHEMCEHNQKIKSQLIQNYEKQLLQIYRQNDRLKKIMSDKMKQFNDQNTEIKERLLKMRQQQEIMKEIELQKLQQSYFSLGDKYNHYQQITDQQIDKNKQQLQLLRQQEMQKYTQKLLLQQKKKQSNLSQLGKIQKQIQRFKKRSIYFQNLIVQTRNQIEQLAYDVNIYQQKKSSLMKELENKQETIQLKQTQIIGHLKKTTEMKKIKNIHEFQLEQFQAQIVPVQRKISQLENKVRQMNHQIMLQFNSKVQQNSLIETSHSRIEKLKLKSKNVTENALNTKTKMLRFTESLTQILSIDPFANDIRKKLSKVIDNFSTNKSQTFAPNYDIEKQKKHSQHLIKRKNMLLKSIEREQRIQQGIVKNKNQFFRFYTDNTNLVKQYNQLFKDHNILMNQKIQLQKKIIALKQETHKTPVKRTISLHTIKKVSGTKLTPFQRYEQQHVQLSNLKLKEKDTTQTRMSRGKSSSSFLKSIIKDVSIAESKYQKANLMRDRIRTFANPELQRQKQIQRQLFQRQKGKSSYMPVLKL